MSNSIFIPVLVSQIRGVVSGMHVIGMVDKTDAIREFKIMKNNLN